MIHSTDVVFMASSDEVYYQHDEYVVNLHHIISCLNEKTYKSRLVNSIIQNHYQPTNNMRIQRCPADMQKMNLYLLDAMEYILDNVMPSLNVDKDYYTITFPSISELRKFIVDGDYIRRVYVKFTSVDDDEGSSLTLFSIQTSDSYIYINTNVRIKDDYHGHPQVYTGKNITVLKDENEPRILLHDYGMRDIWYDMINHNPLNYDLKSMMEFWVRLCADELQDGKIYNYIHRL